MIMSEGMKSNLWSILRLVLNALAGYCAGRPEPWALQLSGGIFAVTASWTVIDNKAKPPSSGDAPKPPNIVQNLSMFCVLGLILTGCAINRPFIQEKITAKDGTVTVRTVKLTTIATWPATQEISKQRGSLGKTLSAGTFNADQETVGGTNGVEALRVINDILGKIHP